MNEGRIRLILNVSHTKEQIHLTVDALERICKKYQIIGSYSAKSSLENEH